MVHQARSGAGHPKSSATDGYGDQEQLERAEKGQGWAQPWITKAHLVKSQMVNDLKSESGSHLVIQGVQNYEKTSGSRIGSRLMF